MIVEAYGKLSSGGEGRLTSQRKAILFCREANLCGTAVEAQYYAPKDSQGKRKRISTKHICCHCNTDRNLAKNKDVEEREERMERPFHPICKDCLCNGVPVVYAKGGRKNRLDKSNEKRK